MTQAVAGPGFLLKNAGTTISEVLDISGPKQTLEKDDVTNQSSPNFYKEWITTLIDGGPVTFSCNYIPGDATQGSVSGLLSWLQGRGLQTWTIEPPSPNEAHTVAFSAYVTSWDPDWFVAKAAKLKIELYVSGPVVVS
jgi:hypothetical protein